MQAFSPGDQLLILNMNLFLPAVLFITMSFGWCATGCLISSFFFKKKTFKMLLQKIIHIVHGDHRNTNFCQLWAKDDNSTWQITNQIAVGNRQSAPHGITFVPSALIARDSRHAHCCCSTLWAHWERGTILKLYDPDSESLKCTIITVTAATNLFIYL